DERRDPYKATEAAVNYLADLRERLGSVYLAAAAYNAGVGRTERGIARLPGGGRGGSGGDPDSVSDLTFFQLADRRYLRRETRDYVPKLIAASLIAKQPRRYGFEDVEPLPPLVFDEITVADATGLDVIARLADTSVAAILELISQFVRGITPPQPRYGRVSRTEASRGSHRVQSGETVSEIARRYGVSLTALLNYNGLTITSVIRAGDVIKIPQK